MEEVHFLTVEEARKIAEEHEHDESWSIWEDEKARKLGELKRMLQKIDHEVKKSA